MRKQKCLEETRGNHKMVGGGRMSELFFLSAQISRATHRKRVCLGKQILRGIQ